MPNPKLSPSNLTGAGNRKQSKGLRHVSDEAENRDGPVSGHTRPQTWWQEWQRLRFCAPYTAKAFDPHAGQVSTSGDTLPRMYCGAVSLTTSTCPTLPVGASIFMACGSPLPWRILGNSIVFCTVISLSGLVLNGRAKTSHLTRRRLSEREFCPHDAW